MANHHDFLPEPGITGRFNPSGIEGELFPLRQMPSNGEVFLPDEKKKTLARGRDK